MRLNDVLETTSDGGILVPGKSGSVTYRVISEKGRFLSLSATLQNGAGLTLEVPPSDTPMDIRVEVLGSHTSSVGCILGFDSGRRFYDRGDHSATYPDPLAWRSATLVEGQFLHFLRGLGGFCMDEPSSRREASYHPSYRLQSRGGPFAQ